jgi:hypothetical protein
MEGVPNWKLNSENQHTFNGIVIFIFASQGLRFGSPFSPLLADLEYILRIRDLYFIGYGNSTRIQSEDVLHGAHVIDEM